MRWILLDVVLALLCLAALAVVALGLWRRVKALGGAVRVATEQLESVTAQLDTIGAREPPFAAPTPAGHVRQARTGDPGVRSSRSS